MTCQCRRDGGAGEVRVREESQSQRVSQSVKSSGGGGGAEEAAVKNGESGNITVESIRYDKIR